RNVAGVQTCALPIFSNCVSTVWMSPTELDGLPRWLTWKTLPPYSKKHEIEALRASSTVWTKGLLMLSDTSLWVLVPGKTTEPSEIGRASGRGGETGV